jgi:multidrug efflux system outer membrane protein
MAKRIIPLAALLLAGCSLAPADVRPEPLAKTTDWYAPEAAADPAGSIRATDIGYDAFFPDPRLRSLIALSLERNRDLAVSVARIAEARGLWRIQGADQGPTLAASAAATRNRAAAVDAGGQPITGNRASIGIAVPAFELDFWGRVRNLTDAARGEYLATVAGERAARLALIRNLAGAYYQAREADERIALAEATLKSREDGLRIARRRLDAGVTSALDYRQSESLLTQAETELAALKLARTQARNIVLVLIGGELPADMPEALPLAAQTPLKPLAAGLPSALLTARPDIMAAEQQLKAARANVGAARAAFFPSIALTGTLGYASSELSGLFTKGGLTWSFGPGIDLPIFDWGRRKGNVDVAVARADIAVATYERTVQEAFREVSTGLAGRQHLAEEVAAQERAAKAQREIARLARIRYREGVADYLEVLDAERNLFTAEQSLISLRREELDNLAALYAALGGGLPPSQ